MLEFFNNPDIHGQGILRPTTWPYIKEGLNKNLKTVKDYYNIKPFAVKSNHILSRILNNIGVSYFYTLERFADIVDAKAFNIAMGMKMSSPIYRGNIFKDVFYGGDIDEVLVAVDDPFDIYDVYKNWKKVSAVKVIYHPKSDLDLQILNGRYFGTESGTAVISINIALLAVQYKAFLEKEITVLESGESPKSTAQFIHMYVLPNMLDSHLDIALFNRAFNLLTNSQMGVSYKRHVFYLTDYTNHVDNVYNDLIKHYKTNDRHYKTLLRSFPVAVQDNFEEVLYLPDNAPTKQSIWTNVVARLKPIEFLIKLSQNNGNKLDRTVNNMILRYFKLYENDGALDTILTNRSQIQNKIIISEIKNLMST